MTTDNISTAPTRQFHSQSNVGVCLDYRLMYLTVTDASVSSKEMENVVISNNSKRTVPLERQGAVMCRYVEAKGTP